METVKHLTLPDAYWQSSLWKDWIMALPFGALDPILQSHGPPVNDFN